MCTTDKCLWSVLHLVPQNLGELDESLPGQEGLFLTKVSLIETFYSSESLEEEARGALRLE